ncbi:elongation factor P hydroxylase [Halomonas alkaliantarctica]|uniref:Elongation factor P hydroxylase n=1 Tax=Halomonas alkaliantarctica TaxID=232346 RepID=A0ABY8LHW2_9GAMM|nr:elongation factor P hydroxylase [Halomonas alkaliantarctica]WGI24045.1 elongation factor P hydroxylase [Halomonas alkaliantarctica]
MSDRQERWTLKDITALFDGIFAERYQTRLIRGGDEPLYRPANSETPYHQVIFARGYYASALHEISHWCIAGAQRRQQEDYGYWYCPDGRDAEQQKAFEQAEIAPQALESIFTRACGRMFHVSVDNLGGDIEVDIEAFAARVEARAQRYLYEGLPTRANAFKVALEHFYQHQETLAEAVNQAHAALDEKDKALPA